MKFHVVTSTEYTQPGEAVTKALAEGMARLFPLPHHPESVSRLFDEQAAKDATSVQSPLAAPDPAKA